MGYRPKLRILKEEAQVIEKQIFDNLSHQVNANQTTLRFPFTPARKAKSNSTSDSSCWGGCGVEGTLIHYWRDCELVQPLWK